MLPAKCWTKRNIWIVASIYVLLVSPRGRKSWTSASKNQSEVGMCLIKSYKYAFGMGFRWLVGTPSANHQGSDVNRYGIAHGVYGQGVRWDTNLWATGFHWTLTAYRNRFAPELTDRHRPTATIIMMRLLWQLLFHWQSLIYCWEIGNLQFCSYFKWTFD